MIWKFINLMIKFFSARWSSAYTVVVNEAAVKFRFGAIKQVEKLIFDVT